jgi:hypothetical protein
MKNPPLEGGFFILIVLGNAQKINDEDQRSSGQTVTTTGRAIRNLRWANEGSPAANLHARDSILPALDKTVERELNWLAAAPGRVKLFAGLVVNAKVVHLHGRALWGLGAVTDDYFLDGEYGWGWFKHWFDTWSF